MVVNICPLMNIVASHLCTVDVLFIFCLNLDFILIYLIFLNQLNKRNQVKIPVQTLIRQDPEHFFQTLLSALQRNDIQIMLQRQLH